MTSTIPIPVAPRTAFAYCEDKLANADLTYYYALLFAPRNLRPAYTALYAFWEEVREVPRECSDPEVARVKLAWWHEEIHGLYAGRPRHPVAHALRPVVTRYTLPAGWFLEAIEMLARHATSGVYPNHEALVAHGTGTRGRVEQLAARLTGVDTPIVAEVGARLELTRLLREVRADAARGRMHLPHDMLARFAVAPHDLLTDRLEPSATALLRAHAERLRCELDDSLAQLPASDRSRVLPLVAAAEMDLVLLDRLAAKPHRLLEGRPALPPLRQLWTAWRGVRRSVAAR